MKSSDGQQPANRRYIHVGRLDLGTHYEGAELEGTFKIRQAAKIIAVEEDQEEGLPNAISITNSLPHLRLPFLVVSFRASARKAGLHEKSFRIETDQGWAREKIVLRVRGGLPAASLLIAESPYTYINDLTRTTNLNHLIQELRLQCMTLQQLPHESMTFRQMLLSGSGLLTAGDEMLNAVAGHIENGNTAIIWADLSFVDTIDSANKLVERYGLRFESRDYDEVVCDSKHVRNHRATQGVEKLCLRRPSPIRVFGSARALVQNPLAANEAFVACSGPKENLYAIGSSDPLGFLCTGWPFNNARLLANLLRDEHFVYPS